MKCEIQTQSAQFERFSIFLNIQNEVRAILARV